MGTPPIISVFGCRLLVYLDGPIAFAGSARFFVSCSFDLVSQEALLRTPLKCVRAI